MIYQRLAKVFLIRSSERQANQREGRGTQAWTGRKPPRFNGTCGARPMQSIGRVRSYSPSMKKTGRCSAHLFKRSLWRCISNCCTRFISAIRSCDRPIPADQGSTRHGDGKTLFFRNPSPRLSSIRLSFRPMNSRWQKTAMVITKALKRCETLGLPVEAEVVGVRIQALAEADSLEGEGDLRKWRYSEVRLNAEERRDV